MREAEKQTESAPLMAAHHALGGILLFLGHLTQAQEHLEKSIRLYQPQSSQVAVTDQFSGAKAMANRAFTAWLLGYPDRAWSWAEIALDWAEAEANANTKGYVQIFATMILDFRGETPKMQHYAEAIVDHAAQYALPYWHAGGAVIRNAALVKQGKVGADVLETMRIDLARYQAAGAVVGAPYMMSLLASAMGRFGRLDEGLALLDEALAVVGRTEHRTWEPELHRLKGDLLQQGVGGDMAAACFQQAEACLQKAIDLAHQQRSRSLELRAVTSLSRLWQRQGKPQAAYQALTAIYDWFNEGFETLDLIEAAQLRAELAERVAQAQKALSPAPLGAIPAQNSTFG